VLPKQSNGDCSALCGDGIIIFPYEQCDDGNTLSGDGCSSSCAIEDYSACGGTPSSCFLNQNIGVQLVSLVVSVDSCNTVTFGFKLMPDLVIFSVYPTDWSGFITTTNPALTVVPNSLNYSGGLVTVSYKYSQTIQNAQIYFTINPVGMVNSTYLSTVSAFGLNVTVQPTNNVAAVYCDKEVCGVRGSSSRFATFQATVAYIGLACSLFSFKLAGLEMFGMLQLGYFILADYDYVNPVFLGVLDRK
jgi:cysteine-rich repeat protein